MMKGSGSVRSINYRIWTHNTMNTYGTAPITYQGGSDVWKANYVWFRDG